MFTSNMLHCACCLQLTRLVHTLNGRQLAGNTDNTASSASSCALQAQCLAKHA